MNLSKINWNRINSLLNSTDLLNSVQSLFDFINHQLFILYVNFYWFYSILLEELYAKWVKEFRWSIAILIKILSPIVLYVERILKNISISFAYFEIGPSRYSISRVLNEKHQVEKYRIMHFKHFYRFICWVYK